MGALESLSALGSDWTDGRKNQGGPAPSAPARPPVSSAGATLTATGSREPATGSNTDPTNEMLQELLSFEPIQHLNDKFKSDDVVMWPGGENKTIDEKIDEDLGRMKRDVMERWVPIYDLPKDEKVRDLIFEFLTYFIKKGNAYVQSQVTRAELCIRSSLDADDAWGKMEIFLSITAAALDDSMDELFNLFIGTFESYNPALYHQFSSIGLEMDILAAAVTPIMWNLTVDNRSVSHTAALATRIIECTSAEDVRREVVNATNGFLEAMEPVLMDPWHADNWPLIIEDIKRWKEWKQIEKYECPAGEFKNFCDWMMNTDTKKITEQISYGDGLSTTVSSDCDMQVEVIYISSDDEEVAPIRDTSFFGAVAEIFGFSRYLIICTTRGRLEDQIALYKVGHPTHDVQVAMKSEVLAVLQTFGEKRVPLTPGKVRWHEARAGQKPKYRQAYVTAEQFQQLCMGAFLHSLRALKQVSVIQRLTDTKGEQAAVVELGATQTLLASMDELRALLAGNIRECSCDEVKNAIESMPHIARHAVCKVFAECSRQAPAEVKRVLESASARHAQLEKGRAHYRTVQIFASKSSIRLVPGSVVAKLLIDLIKGCPDLEKPVKQTVQLIAMWQIVFATVKLEAARSIFSKALLEEIHTTTFDILITNFSDKLEFADSKAAVAVVDRCGRLPETTGEIAYCQSLASGLNGELDGTHDACKKVPKLTQGSLYAELVGYSERSILAGWQAAEKDLYDGYGAPIVAVLPGALGGLMMQDMAKITKCQTAIVSAAFGVHAENANETAGTVHLRALHNKVLQKWVQKQEAAIGHESSGFMCKPEWSGGGSIYTLIRCHANTRDCLDDVLARIQDKKIWKDEVLVSAGVQVESIRLSEQVDLNDTSPPKLRMSQRLDQHSPADGIEGGSGAWGQKRKREEPH